MNLQKSIIIGAVLFIVAITTWEFYWRSEGYIAGLEDDKALWAVQRAKVPHGSTDDVVLFGSSRLLFDIQLPEFEKETGIKPIQLATTGASPLPGFHDLVENTTFAGTVIVGVTPGLFFSTTFPKATPWNRIQSRVNYFYDRTYAQRLNHSLSIPLQNSFAFLTADEENWNDDIDLKTLMSNIKTGNRIDEMPPFYRFQNISIDRNVKMKTKTVQDTAFANSIITVWKFFGETAPPPDKESTIAFFLKDAKKFTARGGNLILVRCPSIGGERIGESIVIPRTEFWDDLIDQAKVPSYHFEDYEQLRNFDCPEWSHLSAPDAAKFTTELVTIMMNDGTLTNLKNQ